MKRLVTVYVIILLFSAFFVSCETKLDAIKNVDVTFKIGGEEFQTPFTANVGDEIEIVIDGDAQFYSFWPGTPNASYSDYGEEDAEGVSLTRNELDMYTTTYTYTETGTFSFDIVCRNYNYGASKYDEKIISGEITITDNNN